MIPPRDPGQQAEWLRLLLDESDDLLLLVDEHGTISYANGVTGRTLRRTPAEIVGQSVFDFCHYGERLIFERLLHTVSSGGQARAHGEVRFSPLEPATEFLSSAANVTSSFEVDVRDARGTLGGLLLSLHDISERVLMEDSMTRSHALDGMGRLAGGVAHDFNNLLQVISCYAELLVESPDLSEDDKLAVEEICAAARRGSGMTSKLLAFGQKQMSTPTLIDLNEVLRELEPELREQTNGLEFKLDLGAGPCRLKLDREQVRQMVQILVANAVDAQPDGGRVEVATAVIEKLENVGSIPDEDSPYVVLRIRDEGVGMDDTTLTHLFEPFFTTKEVGQGTGLGLATVHGIVKQNQGYLSVSTDPGQGATFLIYLPEAEGEIVDVVPSQAPAPAPQDGVRVLLVEDETTVRGIVTRLLVRDGYQVVAAADVQEAELCFEKGGVDFLLTDISLPDGNGLDLAVGLREKQGDLPVLLMSGYPIDALDESTFGGRTGFLQKPFPNRALQSAVAELLAPRD